ncbi:hypothetical protein M0812_11505 [Anaeramoeba flamelloides]|uniref:Uncharacterized protein n=1 Tax=Anaeramoeba flamelloides TaxID=1746091 RepID=A0AAV7ZUK6_9EUKA|nr:hypothetical protein M0812_11505 [Anaeramoeba flamelloides]
MEEINIKFASDRESKPDKEALLFAKQNKITIKLIHQEETFFNIFLDELTYEQTAKNEMVLISSKIGIFRILFTNGDDYEQLIEFLKTSKKEESQNQTTKEKKEKNEKKTTNPNSHQYDINFSLKELEIENQKANLILKKDFMEIQTLDDDHILLMIDEIVNLNKKNETKLIIPMEDDILTLFFSKSNDLQVFLKKLNKILKQKHKNFDVGSNTPKRRSEQISIKTPKKVTKTNSDSKDMREEQQKKIIFKEQKEYKAFQKTFVKKHNKEFIKKGYFIVQYKLDNARSTFNPSYIKSCLHSICLYSNNKLLYYGYSANTKILKVIQLTCILKINSNLNISIKFKSTIELSKFTQIFNRNLDNYLQIHFSKELNILRKKEKQIRENYRIEKQQKGLLGLCDNDIISILDHQPVPYPYVFSEIEKDYVIQLPQSLGHDLMNLKINQEFISISRLTKDLKIVSKPWIKMKLMEFDSFNRRENYANFKYNKQILPKIYVKDFASKKLLLQTDQNWKLLIYFKDNPQQKSFVRLFKKLRMSHQKCAIQEKERKILKKLKIPDFPCGLFHVQCLSEPNSKHKKLALDLEIRSNFMIFTSDKFSEKSFPFLEKLPNIINFKSKSEEEEDVNESLEREVNKLPKDITLKENMKILHTLDDIKIDISINNPNYCKLSNTLNHYIWLNFLTPSKVKEFIQSFKLAKKFRKNQIISYYKNNINQKKNDGIDDDDDDGSGSDYEIKKENDKKNKIKLSNKKKFKLNFNNPNQNLQKKNSLLQFKNFTQKIAKSTKDFQIKVLDLKNNLVEGKLILKNDLFELQLKNTNDDEISFIIGKFSLSTQIFYDHPSIQKEVIIKSENDWYPVIFKNKTESKMFQIQWRLTKSKFIKNYLKKQNKKIFKLIIFRNTIIKNPDQNQKPKYSKCKFENEFIFFYLFNNDKKTPENYKYKINGNNLSHSKDSKLSLILTFKSFFSSNNFYLTFSNKKLIKRFVKYWSNAHGIISNN